MDQDVHELEKEARLQEIYNRMDPRAQTPVPGKGPFGRDELLRRKLIHEGCLLWKTATGRFKGQWSSWQTSELDILLVAVTLRDYFYSLWPCKGKSQRQNLLLQRCKLWPESQQKCILESQSEN